MAVPVISPTTSILDFPLGETWIFQPSASNSPTSWSWTNLPPGLSVSSTTGAIGGRVLVQGVWIATVTASNGDGASATMEIPISVYAGIWNNPAAVQVKIDAGTGTVLSPASLALKSDSDILLDVSFYDSASNLLALPVTALSFVLKASDGGEPLVQTAAFSQVGDVTTRAFEIVAPLRGDALARQLALSSASAVVPAVAAQAEFRFTYSYMLGGTAAALKRVSSTFPVTITRNLLGS